MNDRNGFNNDKLKKQTTTTDYILLIWPRYIHNVVGMHIFVGVYPSPYSVQLCNRTTSEQNTKQKHFKMALVIRSIKSRPSLICSQP